jgi:hypothetical protein
MAFGNILGGFTEYSLTGQAVNTTITTPVMQGELVQCPHQFIGVTFTDGNGTAVTPGAGTYTVTAETLNNPGVFQAITNGTTVDATAALTTLSAAANVTRWRVVSTGITTATLLNIKVTANAA